MLTPATEYVTRPGGPHEMTRKIALVEDSAIVRQSLREMFRDFPGFEIIGEYDHAGDAIAAIAVEPPDIILLDIRLRASNGMEVLKYVNKALPHIIVIVFSSQSDQLNRARALDAGAAIFLSKTDDIEQLHDVLTGLAADE
jgi:DNA-binding NarL/FixJ family response regulator